MKNDISFPTENDFQLIKDLWKETFLDTEEYIDSFFSKMTTSKNCLVVKDVKRLVGFLFFLDANLICDKTAHKAYYLYAIATDRDYRGQGIMKALEEEVYNLATINNVSLLVLVPATKSLFKMYEKLGYKTAFYAEKTTLAARFTSDYSLTPCNKQDFLNSRKAYMEKNKVYFDFDEKGKVGRFDEANIYGEILWYKDALVEGYFVLEKKDDCYTILESDLRYDALCRVAFALMQRDNSVKRVQAININGQRYEYGMLKSLDKGLNVYDIRKKNPYMNLMFN